VPDDRKFSGLNAYQQAIGAGADLVLLCTPPGFRPAQFEAAVKAGRHVFMEKPVAVDGPGIRKVLAANEEAKKKGLAVAVGHHLRHEEKHRVVVQHIHDGSIGPVKFLRAYFNTGGLWVRPRTPGQTEMEHQVRNWYYFTWLSGDHIVEQHVHDLDVCNWIMQGTPVEAQALGGRQVRKGPNYGEIFDHHAVEYTYRDGTKMFSYCRQIDNCWGSFSQHAHGVKGSVHIDGHGTSELRIDGQEPQRWKRGKDGHQVEQDDLLAALLAGKAYNEGEWAAHSTLTAILGRMASYSGRIVTWDEALKSDLDLLPKSLVFDAQPLVLPNQDGEYPCATPGKTKAV
jgi:predicted dehydrogenase